MNSSHSNQKFMTKENQNDAIINSPTSACKETTHLSPTTRQTYFDENKVLIPDIGEVIINYSYVKFYHI